MSKSMIVRAASITAALALMGGATFATFSSTAANTANTFAAGTLTLAINGSEGTSSTPVFTVSNMKPGDTATQVLNLSNTGSLTMNVMKLSSITETGSTPNLGDKLNLELWNDVDDSGTLNGGDTQIGSTRVLTDAGWTDTSLGFTVAAAGHHKVLAKVTLDPLTDNTYQGKNANFSFNFYSEQ